MLASLNNANEYKSISIPMRMAEDIAGKIHTGIYSGKIPSVQMLAREHNVNFKTANRAVALLVKEKVLDCKKGCLGTHVTANGKAIASQIRKKNHVEKLIFFFMTSLPHLYGELYNKTTACLNRDNYLPIIINDGDHNSILARAMEMKPECLVINSWGNKFPYEKLYDISKSGIRIVFQLKAECEIPSFADYVLSDTVYGAYIATKHLIDQGHRKILLLTYSPAKVPPMIYRHTVQFQMLQGYRMALEEAGLSDNEMILYETVDEQANKQKFKELLSVPQRPTAVFSDGDFRIVNLYGTIRKLGLSVPDDLALVGYYDTPHCQFCEVPLTSVSLNIDAIAKCTVECVTAEKEEHKRIIIKPELVIRESSAAGK